MCRYWDCYCHYTQHPEEIDVGVALHRSSSAAASSASGLDTERGPSYASGYPKPLSRRTVGPSGPSMGSIEIMESSRLGATCH